MAEAATTPGGKRHLESWSSFELFYKCARRYWYEKVLKLPVPTGPDLITGSAYHAVLEAIGRCEVTRTGYMPGELAWQVLTRENPKGRSEQDQKSFKDQLVAVNVVWQDFLDELVENIARVQPMWDQARLFPLEISGQPMIERKFFDDVGGLTGVIDIVSKNTPLADAEGVVREWIPDQPCVLDFKTLSSQRRRTARDTEKSGQLALYCLQTGVRTAGFLEIPRNLDRPINVRTNTFSDDELRWWKEWFDDGVRALTTMRRIDDINLFPRCSRSNGLCSPRFCPFWDKCYPGAPAPAEEKEVDSPQ